MQAFLQARDRPLVWVGDLNVCLLESDVSHPVFFAKQVRFLFFGPSPSTAHHARLPTARMDGNITRHVHVQHAPAQRGPDNRQPSDPSYRGQPGYTLIERRHFANLLAAGGLLDAYRTLHPEEHDCWTWRGSGPPHARYYAKGARAFASFRRLPLARLVV